MIARQRGWLLVAIAVAVGVACYLPFQDYGCGSDGDCFGGICTNKGCQPDCASRSGCTTCLADNGCQWTMGSASSACSKRAGKASHLNANDHLVVTDKAACDCAKPTTCSACADIPGCQWCKAANSGADSFCEPSGEECAGNDTRTSVSQCTECDHSSCRTCVPNACKWCDSRCKGLNASCNGTTAWSTSDCP